MVSPLYLDHEGCTGDSSEPPSPEDEAAPLKPDAVKKVTRQWAAWTRPEEESFFAALRQVGKNFEKVTYHVQSKNKDQVRHYYYRLVRRMNKMLDPELRIDPKNSEDTVAAMLRWWSLLENYGCKASKLHLKPRRFKIFIEALENQLLKDQKKNTRKRLATGENNASTVHNSVSDQVRVSGRSNRAAKVVLDGRQNVQKAGNRKRSLPKRPKNSEPDPTTVKAARKRRKTGLKSTAENKRLEMAAIAGVSLVADAAEYLERVDTDKEIEHVQQTPGGDCSQHVASGAHSLPLSPQSNFNNQSIHNSEKLKLQLFPIDEFTQKALEKDNHNPHLELTLSTRKKISSVLEHLNRKWGNSSLLSQELMLFPYGAQRENLFEYQKWTKDSLLCAVDVYNLIENPPVFRLRYGWFSKEEVESATAQAVTSDNLNVKNPNFSIAEEQNVEIEYPSGPPVTTNECGGSVSNASPITTNECGGSVSNASVAQYRDNSEFESSLGTQQGAIGVTARFGTMDMVSSDEELTDGIPNISVEDLLSEPQHETNVNYSPFRVPVSSNSLEQMPFSCDSFDAAIAAFLCKDKNKADIEPGVASSSIWDADETCDAFSFQRSSASCDKVEESLEEDKLQNNTPTFGDMIDDCWPDHSSKNSTKASSGLTDISWPASLGTPDLEIPSCRNNSDDLIFSDSLNNLLANSLETFQSCLFGLDKKEAASTAEALQTASFSDFRISSLV